MATKKPAKARPTAPAAAKKTAKKSAKKTATQRAPLQPDPDGVVRLSGGNPQIAKGYGDAPIQAYIAAMPGWKRDVGRRLDALITKAVPGVRKAVKWNSPMYGAEEGHYFLGIHVFAHYVKVAFFRGTSLRPLPPGESKQKEVRYVDIREEGFDEAQMVTWVKQAAALPGERM